MTKLEALKELAAKVEAGTLRSVNDAAELLDIGGLPHAYSTHAPNLVRAFNGSRDAADALRKAVLPTDFFMSSDSTGFALVWRDEYEVTHNWSALIPGNQARAELLAILRALIAMEEAQ